jgi:hypothetical protein
MMHVSDTLCIRRFEPNYSQKPKKISLHLCRGHIGVLEKPFLFLLLDGRRFYIGIVLVVSTRLTLVYLELGHL